MTAAPASAHFTEAKTSLALFNDVSCRDALVKWGLPPTPRASGWLVQHFTFSTADVAQPSTDAMALPLTSLRFFHHGLARPLLQAFFASPAVRAALRAAAPTPRRQAPGGEDVMVDGHDAPRACAVTATPLRRTWTSLDPLDRLAEKGVVRRVPASTTPTAAPDSAYDEDIIFGGERMPIVKCMERSLPQEVLIADELRSLFLSAHSRSTYGGGAEDDEEDEDGMGYYGYGGGRGLSSKELRSIFSDAEREEVLYHILWRLIAGGGAMNQFEDDFCIYKDAARTWMKQLLTSITPTKMEEEDAELIPVIQSHVYQVHSVVDEATGRCVLFGDAAGDDMAPSNLNYCYVIVSPQQDQMVLWYHCS